MFVEMVKQASRESILDILYMVLSNDVKTRVYDYFEDCGEVLRRKLGDEGGCFYVCGSVEVVWDIQKRLERVREAGYVGKSER